MSQKLGIPKGTRDFSPGEMVKRNFIFDNIRNIFRHYGYMPLETPSMENTETLLGKYGEEGDRLIFKIMPRGRKLESALNRVVETKDTGAFAKASEEALRYDLTVPFARYVVMHQHEINFPFKRYQIQPVWRADRPQKGRYREFFQCDVDVIGSDSLLNEVELVRIVDEVFAKLKLDDITININNRKILQGLSEVTGEEDKFNALTVALDKLDKVGLEEVASEMVQKGISEQAVEKLRPLLEASLGAGGNNQSKIALAEQYLKDSSTGMEGVNEIKYILEKCNLLGIEKVVFDLTLARGLSYYTGSIFEVKVPDFPSICGGGRYDDLTGIFGLPGISGVGVSFGADRICDILEQKGLFPEETAETTQLMFVNFGEKEAEYCLSLLQKLHKAGIKAELYPDAVKMKKQMKYADSKNVRFVSLIGEEEMTTGVLTIKNMRTGEQSKMGLEELIKILQ